MIRAFVIAGGIAAEALLPDRDDALLGYVVRGRHGPQPAYDVVAFLPEAVTEDLDSSFASLLEQASERAKELSSWYPGVRFMVPTPERKVLDNLARAGALILWDQLYTTIRGVVHVTPNEFALVYDFDDSVRVLRESMDGSDWETDEQVTLDVVDFVDRMLVQAWMGDKTPFILFSPARGPVAERDLPARQDGEALQPAEPSQTNAEISDPGTQPPGADSETVPSPDRVSEHGGGDNSGDSETSYQRDPDRGVGPERPAPSSS